MSNEILYYYTNNTVSILEKKELWLTRSIQSNDAKDSIILSELIKKHNLSQYCLDCINHELEKIGLVKITPINGFDILYQIQNTLKKINNTYLDRINSVADGKYDIFSPMYIPFVICFTTKDNKDSRMFFDTYTNNTGCSIGFNKEGVFDLNHKYYQKGYFILLQDILYSEEAQVDEIKRLMKSSTKIIFEHTTTDSKIDINEVIALLSKINSGYKYLHALTKGDRSALVPGLYHLISERIGTSLVFQTSFIKNDYWKEEAETRLVSFNSYKQLEVYSEEKHKNSFDILQKESTFENFVHFDYLKMPFDLSIIKEIIIGPCVNTQDKERIIALAEQNDIDIMYSSGTDVFVPRKVVTPK